MAATAVVALCLAACSGIPTSGPIHAGDAIGVERDGADEPGTRVLPQSPRPGASQQQIIEGFLNASASFDNDHAVAREFLTSDASKTWNPSAGATIYDSSDDSYENLPTAPDDEIFSTTQVATISVQGEYDNASGPLVQDFKMRKVPDSNGNGQWRIASPPTGLLLTQQDVDRAYRTYDIYFPDPARSGLVPNQVLLPIGPAASTSTALMRALVAGPTQWLAPAVQTAIPTGTKLVVDSAPIVDGVVQVDLTAPAATANAREAQALSAQVVWTLKALNQVTSVRITVDGVPLAGVAALQPIDSLAQWGPDWPDPRQLPSVEATFAGKDRLLRLVNDKPQPVAGVLGNGSFGLHDPAVSYDEIETRVAGLDAARHKLYLTSLIGGDKPPAPVIANATRLTAPTWDRIGNVWTVDQQATRSVVWVVTPGAEPKTVQTEDLPSGRIMAMRISRDGARVALVVQTAGPAAGEVAGQVYLGRVERGAGKLTLSGFKPIKSAFSDITDVAWSSADRLLLLGRTAPGATLQPLLVDLMGTFGRALGPIDPSSVSTQSIVSITAAPLHEVLASTSPDGKIYRYLATGWEPLAEGTDPAYPG